MISKNKLGLLVGCFLGLLKVAWSLLVVTGFAQQLINWIFRLHFIQPPYTVTPFKLNVAVAMIVITLIIGYVIGWVLATIWNWLHPA